MSDQQEVGDSTSLEEVFTSRQFEGASGTAGAGSEGVAGTGGFEDVVTKEFGLATRVTALVLHGNAAVGLHNPPLEDVLHSARGGKPLTLVAPLHTEAPVAAALPAEEGAVTRLEPRRRGHNRYRAIAAVSGVAAAALVVAGVTSGTVQPRASSVFALGQRSTARPQGAFGSPSGAASVSTPAPSGPTPTPTLTAAVGVGAGPLAFAAASPVGSGSASGGHVNPGRPGGTNDTAALSPPPTVVSAPSAGGATGFPPTPAPGGNPVTPVTALEGSTVTAVGTSMTSLADDQLGSSIPMNAVSTVVSGIGQAVNSTTG